MLKNKWRFLPIETYDGYWNMAIDEAILLSVINKKSPYTIRLYKWYPSTASIGRNQSLKTEVDVYFAKKQGFNVVRRITGGGAVFHDEEREITYSIVCPIKFLRGLGANSVLEQFEIITTGIIEGLNKIGLEPEKGIIHCPAIFLNGKKFSGNAQIRKKEFLLQHGTILLDIDPELMYSVLKAPEKVGKSRMVRSVRAKCIGIGEYLKGYDFNRIINALKSGFEKVLKIKLEEGRLSKKELELAERLRKEKYMSDSWLKKYE